MGADSLAISADGARIWYAPLMSRRWYSVSADALADQSLDEQAVAATVVDEGDKGSAADGLETDDAGRFYVTANQLHRQADYQGGEDLREKPYALFRIPIDAGPVRLRWT